MKKLLVAALLALSVCAGFTALPEAQPAATAFVDVNVIPMDKGAVLANQTVVVRDGRITALGTGPANT